MLYSNETPILEYEDQFNGKTEKRLPPSHLIGHEVYDMVKDVHVILDKRKRAGKNIEEYDMCVMHHIDMYQNG
jgi:hypothetical protein